VQATGADRDTVRYGMEWIYDVRTRYWRLHLDGWEARVARWPASFEYTAELHSPEKQPTHAAHVFPTMDAAQTWCLQRIAERQRREPPGTR
jgi:hypothetical protein